MPGPTSNTLQEGSNSRMKSLVGDLITAAEEVGLPK